MIRITRKFGIRGGKYIGFVQFDLKIRSDYAIIRIQITRSSLLVKSEKWNFPDLGPEGTGAKVPPS